MDNKNQNPLLNRYASFMGTWMGTSVAFYVIGKVLKAILAFYLLYKLFIYAMTGSF